MGLVEGGSKTSGASSLKRAVLGSVLVLSCATPAGVRESRESGLLPASFGGPGSVTFALPATAIEPTESALSVETFVTCGEGSSNTSIGVGLNGAPRADAPATIRVDDAEETPLFWTAHQGVGLLVLRTGDSHPDRSGDEWQEELTAMLTGGRDAVVSFEPRGGTRHYFRLDMDGLADRIEMCESGRWTLHRRCGSSYTPRNRSCSMRTDCSAPSRRCIPRS